MKINTHYLLKLVIFGLIFCFPLRSQNLEKIQIKHWSNELGLASNEINCIVQDYKGFLWIGTNSGLNRFDGQSFLTFQLLDKELNNKIKGLLSYKKSIYVYVGDNKFIQIETDSFKQNKVMLNALQDKKLKEALDQFGGNKSIKYDGNSFKLTKKGVLFRNDSIISGVYNNIYKDTRNRLWICSLERGVGYWDDVEERINYVVTTSELKSLYHNESTLPLTKKGIIEEDKSGRIWFYLAHGTIGFWDYETQLTYTIKNIKTHYYFKKAYKLFSTLIDLEIRYLFVDNMGNLWVGTRLNGLIRIRFTQEAFEFYEFDYGSKIGLANEDISCPTPLRNGDIWVGTWGGGINVLKKENLKSFQSNFKVINSQKGKVGALQDSKVFPILEDIEGNIWVGSAGAGLHFLSRDNRKSNKLIFKNYNRKKGTILSDTIMNIYEDHKRTIWISTTKGLTRYLPGKKKFESNFKELEKPDLFKGLYVLNVYEDSNSDLWISTEDNGLFKWDRRSNHIEQITKFDTFSTNSILSVVEDTPGSLWFSGLRGLFHYNSSKGEFNFRVSQEFLPTNHIESMILGADRSLWLGTNIGLYNFIPQTNKVSRINLPMGVRVNSFTRGVSKDSDGYLYFGTRNGFYRFNPNKLKKDKSVAPVFTDFKIDGISYRDRKKNNLSGYDISTINKIYLDFKENTFSISYKCLDYFVEDIEYYQTSMTKEGEKENWNKTNDTSRHWTNLSDGNYTFKVRKDNSEEVIELNIAIFPPWWRSREAFVGYFILLVIGVYKINTRAKNKEKKIQDAKSSELRFQFFHNIAHEIKTPLTLIKGGVERLKDVKSANDTYLYEVDRVYKNTKRLSRLVNEILDLKKIERTEVSLNLKSFNLKLFLESVIDAFMLMDEADLILIAPEGPIWITSDKQLLESIVYNLISNAIKFSEKNSRIEVSLIKSRNGEISIQVKDNGFGIKKEEQELIFERLYQSKEHLKTGTGIGLAIVKQYVNLLQGKINLESDLGRGSTFTVTLPYKEEHLGLDYDNVMVKEPSKNKHASSILVIDDQKEIRTFIKEIFENEHYVFEAPNGEKGLILAKKYQPTLIISDVMMPVMNGLQFSKKVRQDIYTSHIPIVLLTAKTSEEEQIEGLSTGADAYINKPFSQKLLKSRVDGLIENRKKLIKKYSLSIDGDLASLACNDLDKEFLEKFIITLEKCYKHSDLSLEELASKMAISKSGFYTKIKSITGNSPVEFVRIYRLKKAAQLLKSSKLSVTEISENVGFGTQKYFSNTFKRHYGTSPLEYRKL